MKETSASKVVIKNNSGEANPILNRYEQRKQMARPESRVPSQRALGDKPEPRQRPLSAVRREPSKPAGNVKVLSRENSDANLPTRNRISPSRANINNNVTRDPNIVLRK